VVIAGAEIIMKFDESDEHNAALRVLPDDVLTFLNRHIDCPVHHLHFHFIPRGNMNQLIVCRGPYRSAIVKLPRSRINLGVANLVAPVHRARLEAFALRHFGMIAPHSVPGLLFESQERPCLVMEYISEDRQWVDFQLDEQLRVIRERVAPFIKSACEPIFSMPESVRAVSDKMQLIIATVTFQLPFTDRKSVV